MTEPITFLATIPPIMSAIRVSGDGGARVQLDVPDSDMPAITRLLGLRGKLLRVTVEADDTGGDLSALLASLSHVEIERVG